MASFGYKLVFALLMGALVVGTVLTGIPARADPNQLAYGKHLSQECTTCHHRDGTDKGIPSIIGLDRETFVTTFKLYQTGARTNPVMNSVAQALNDEQLQALAAYFASLKPAPKSPGAARRK